MRNLGKAWLLIGPPVIVALLALALIEHARAAGTTYWVNTTGALTACGNVDGPADPGTYMTPANLITAGCMASGDTVMFKGGIYTTTIDWTSLLPSGTVSVKTKALCEAKWTCEIRTQPNSFNTWGVVTIGNASGGREYVQFGSATNGFDVNGANCSASQCSGIKIWNGNNTSNLRGVDVIGNHVRGQHSDGIKYDRNTTTNNAPIDWVVEYNVVEQASAPVYSAQGPAHGIYIKSQGGIVRFNTSTAPGDPAVIGSYAAQCYLPCNNTQIYGNVLLVPGPNRGAIVSQGNGNTLERNVIKRISGTADRCIDVGASSGLNKFYHNLCDGFTDFMTTASNSGSGSEFRNNVCVTGTSCNIKDNHGDLIQSNNSQSVATTHFVDRTNTNYALVAGSTLIDNGGVIAGRPYNGAAPDRGPFETVPCQGGAVTGNLLDLQCSMSLNTPLIPGTLGYTVNNSRSVTGVALSGSSTARLTFDGAACLAGQTWQGTYNQSPGTATDSAMIGGTFNQPIWDFGPVTAANACGGSTYTFTQTTGAFYEALAAQNVGRQIYIVAPRGRFGVRTKFKATGADPPVVTTKLQCSTTGESGTYADIGNNFSACSIRYVGLNAIPGMDDHGTPLSSERLTSEFAGMVPGAVRRCAAGCEVPSLDLSQNSEAEELDMLEVDPSASLDTVIFFRRVLADGTVMTYATNAKPSITVSTQATMKGF